MPSLFLTVEWTKIYVNLYTAVVVVCCFIGSASKYDNFLDVQCRGRDQFRVLQCCSVYAAGRGDDKCSAVH